MVALAFERLRQDYCEFDASLDYIHTSQGYMVRPCLEKQKQKRVKMEVISFHLL